jgi:hypothetical protein
MPLVLDGETLALWAGLLLVASLWMIFTDIHGGK